MEIFKLTNLFPCRGPVFQLKEACGSLGKQSTHSITTEEAQKMFRRILESHRVLDLPESVAGAEGEK